MPFEPSFEHLDSRLALTLKPQRVGQAFVRDVFLGKLLTIAPGHRERVVPTVATIEPPADTVEKRWVDTLGLGSTQPTIELAEGRRDTGFGMGSSKTKLHPNAPRRWLLRMDFGIELGERHRVVERPATLHLERYARQNADTKIVSVPAKIALVQLSVEWSAVEVVTHVKDADGVLNQRVKLLLDQDKPSLEFQAVFEWAESRREASSISDILEAYMKSREETLQRLTDLPFANWWRRGQHQEFGEVTLLQQASYFAAHELTHVRQLNAMTEA